VAVRGRHSMNGRRCPPTATCRGGPWGRRTGNGRRYPPPGEGELPFRFRHGGLKPLRGLRMEFCCAKLRTCIQHPSFPRRGTPPRSPCTPSPSASTAGGLKPLRGLRMEFAAQTPRLYPTSFAPPKGENAAFSLYAAPVTPPRQVGLTRGVGQDILFLSKQRAVLIT
jgi:hypothetical protein